MHHHLNKFWVEQTERIKKESTLTGGQVIIVIIVAILTSFILTPIGGGISAFFVYYLMLKSAKEIKGGNEFYALKHKTIPKLLKKENSEIATLKSQELENAQSAFSVLEKLLSRREKVLKELEAEGFNITSKQLLFKQCRGELQQINESLKTATTKNARLENKILKENMHKKELDKIHETEVEAHKKEVNDRLTLIEKAYGAGIINKTEYEKQKSQLQL